MARINLGDIVLNVEMSGEGPPLLALHGFTGSAATWAPHVPALARVGRVVAVDLIGHGESDAPADPRRYAMERAVDDLLALLDRAGATGRFGVLGYSMGARVALHLEARVPERVAALVLESGSPGLRDADERAARRDADEALAKRIERDGMAPFVDAWERLPLFGSQQTLAPQVRLAQRRQRLQNRPHGLANSLCGMGTGAQASLWDRLGAIRAPTLVIAGAQDLKFRHIAQEMAQALPHAHLEIVRDAGHAVHLERPDLFDRLVADFLGTYLREPTYATNVM